METFPFNLKKNAKNYFIDVLNKILISKSEDLEIEARIGKILDRTTGQRIELGAMHPTILSSHSKHFIFVSNVSDSKFESLLNKFKKYEKTEIDELILIQDKIRVIYCNGKKSVMKKVRIYTYDVHFPGKEYDLRIAISKEEFVNQEIKTKNKATIKRDRSRVSVPIGPFRFDLTKVKTENEMINEVEVEILNNSYDKETFFAVLEFLAE